MHEFDVRKVPRYLAIVAFVCFSIAGLWWLVDTVSRQSLKQRMKTDTDLAYQATQRLDLAFNTWQTQGKIFAAHWSEGLEQSLSAAKARMNPDELAMALTSANEKFAVSDHAVVRSILDDIESRIQEADSVSNRILGPPNDPSSGLYVRLADQAARADTMILTAKTCIATNTPLLTAYINSPNYSFGVTDIAAAKSYLSHAVTANTVKDADGLIDKPQAYLYAESANSTCNMALIHAAPPTPTPLPTYTSESNSSNYYSDSDESADSSSGDSYDWSAGDGDSDSWDSGSDSGGWDSDSWDSGSDSGGWDSDSWDSGSDSGSWDSGW